MILENHIAYRFLTDDTFVMEVIQTMYPESYGKISSGKIEELTEKEEGCVRGLWYLLTRDNQKAYYITETVIEKLNMLHLTKKKEGLMYDWTVFSQVSDCKKTFILPFDSENNSHLLRIRIADDIIEFFHTTFEPNKQKKYHGQSKWVIFYVNKITGEQCDHFNHIDVKTIEDFVYRLMCFIFLVDNDEIVVAPKSRYGTKKSGKLINCLKIPVTIVNSRWNTTVIRTEKFGVRGHFAIRWTGVGRTMPKVVFIEPFEKKGYIRQSGKILDTNKDE